MTLGKDARWQQGQNPSVRAENGAIWRKLRPTSILAEAHFGPEGSSGPWLGYDMASSGLWGDSGVHFPSKCAEMHGGLFKIEPLGIHFPISEFTSGSRGSAGNGPRTAVQTPRFFTPGARMTVVQQTPSNESVAACNPATRHHQED